MAAEQCKLMLNKELDTIQQAYEKISADMEVGYRGGKVLDNIMQCRSHKISAAGFANNKLDIRTTYIRGFAKSPDTDDSIAACDDDLGDMLCTILIRRIVWEFCSETKTTKIDHF